MVENSDPKVQGSDESRDCADYLRYCKVKIILVLVVPLLATSHDNQGNPQCHFEDLF